MTLPAAFLPQPEERQNEEIIRLSNQILDLTKAIHGLAVNLQGAPDTPPSPDHPVA
jgi:hypothetical protein